MKRMKKIALSFFCIIFGMSLISSITLASGAKVEANKKQLIATNGEYAQARWGAEGIETMPSGYAGGDKYIDIKYHGGHETCDFIGLYPGNESKRLNQGTGIEDVAGGKGVDISQILSSGKGALKMWMYISDSSYFSGRNTGNNFLALQDKRFILGYESSFDDDAKTSYIKWEFKELEKDFFHDGWNYVSFNLNSALKSTGENAVDLQNIRSMSMKLSGENVAQIKVLDVVIEELETAQTENIKVLKYEYTSLSETLTILNPTKAYQSNSWNNENISNIPSSNVGGYAQSVTSHGTEECEFTSLVGARREVGTVNASLDKGLDLSGVDIESSVISLQIYVDDISKLTNLSSTFFIALYNGYYPYNLAEEVNYIKWDLSPLKDKLISGWTEILLSLNNKDNLVNENAKLDLGNVQSVMFKAVGNANNPNFALYNMKIVKNKKINSSVGLAKEPLNPNERTLSLGDENGDYAQMMWGNENSSMIPTGKIGKSYPIFEHARYESSNYINFFPTVKENQPEPNYDIYAKGYDISRFNQTKTVLNLWLFVADKTKLLSSDVTGYIGLYNGRRLDNDGALTSAKEDANYIRWEWGTFSYLLDNGWNNISLSFSATNTRKDNFNTEKLTMLKVKQSSSDVTNLYVYSPKIIELEEEQTKLCEVLDSQSPTNEKIEINLKGNELISGKGASFNNFTPNEKINNSVFLETSLTSSNDFLISIDYLDLTKFSFPVMKVWMFVSDKTALKDYPGTGFVLYEKSLAGTLAGTQGIYVWFDNIASKLENGWNEIEVKLYGEGKELNNVDISRIGYIKFNIANELKNNCLFAFSGFEIQNKIMDNNYEKKSSVPPSESFEIEKIINLAVGETKKINAKLQNKYTDTLIWEVLDNSLAEVDNLGRVKGLKEGIVTLKCTLAGTAIYKEMQLEVRSIIAKTLYLNHKSINGLIGEKIYLLASFEPYNANSCEIEWISSDENVAEVKGGSVIIKGKGKTIITAKIKGTDITAYCEIEVNDEIVISYKSEIIILVSGIVLAVISFFVIIQIRKMRGKI